VDWQEFSANKAQGRSKAGSYVAAAESKAPFAQSSPVPASPVVRAEEIKSSIVGFGEGGLGGMLGGMGGMGGMGDLGGLGSMFSPAAFKASTKP